MNIEQTQGNNIPEIFVMSDVKQDIEDTWISKGVRMLSEQTKVKTCETDQDCFDKVNSFYRCKPSEDNALVKVCIHKPIWPLDPIEWLGTFLFSVIMCLSNVGGIGGGGIAIPMVQIFFGWDDLKKAIAISSFSICCSSFGRFMFNWNERHPEKPTMAAIDYGLTNVMMPLALIGTQVGAFLYLVCPALVINVLLTLLLIFLWIKSLLKAVDIIKKENKEAAMKDHKKITQVVHELSQLSKSGNQVIVEESPTKPSLHIAPLTSMYQPAPDDPIEVDPEEIFAPGAGAKQTDEYGLPLTPTGDESNDAEILELKGILKQERSHWIWKKQTLNFVALLINITMNICRKSVFEKCSAPEWVTIILFLILMVIFVLLAVKNVAYEQTQKQKFNNVNISKSDLVFKGETLKSVLMLGFGGGFVAGALGLGGGVIFNPYLIGMGVPPKVSSSTGMYLVMFSTTAASIFYILAGFIDIGYGIWMAAWSIAGSIIGLYGANWYMKKFGRQSVIVVSLTFILFLAVIGQPTYNFLLMAQQIEDGQNVMEFTSLCKAKK